MCAHQVCLQYARKLLRSRASWPLPDFMAEWQSQVPTVYEAKEDTIQGEAVYVHKEAGMMQHCRTSVVYNQLGLCCVLVEIAFNLAQQKRSIDCHVLRMDVCKTTTLFACVCSDNCMPVYTRSVNLSTYSNLGVLQV